MCVAVPGHVVEINGGESIVEFGKIKKLVNTCLIDDLKVGDYVLVHVGCAIDKIDKDETDEMSDIFKEILNMNPYGNGDE